jgi:hypothetical protein
MKRRTFARNRRRKPGEVLTIESIRYYRAKMKAPRVALA